MSVSYSSYLQTVLAAEAIANDRKSFRACSWYTRIEAGIVPITSLDASSPATNLTGHWWLRGDPSHAFDWLPNCKVSGISGKHLNIILVVWHTCHLNLDLLVDNRRYGRRPTRIDLRFQADLFARRLLSLLLRRCLRVLRRNLPIRSRLSCLRWLCLSGVF